MAGTGAGRLSNTFPDINGGYLPGPFFRFDGLAQNLLHNPLAIHWAHRAWAWLLLLAGVGLLAITMRRFAPGPIRHASYLLGGALLLQFVLGALTVVLRVPVSLAAAHQVCGYLLWSTAILFCHRLSGRGALLP